MIYQLRLERSRGALPIYRLAQELRVGIPVQKALHIARGMPGALGTAQWAAYQPEAFPGIN